jgi:glutathione S-transferase
MLRLVIGNKNYSSWSLRPWLLLRHFDVPFEEIMLALDSARFRSEIAGLSPSRRVPALHHDDLVVWDSLAICEYVNETFLDGRGWPGGRESRALARSAAAEMHSGFPDLRTQFPMNCARVADGYRGDARSAPDVARIGELWNDLRRRHAAFGDFLCGEFGIVDAMFAPVAVRFHGYGIAPDPVCEAYVRTLYALPAMREWIEAGINEPERLAKYEQIGK